MKLCGLCKKRRVMKSVQGEGTRCKACIRNAVRKVMKEDRKILGY